jgi:glycosyltransferase involved in cell wall biosynthesis
MPKVSVIIPTYNRGRFVGKAIESVLDQNFDDFEVIVVDDGSTDNTHQTLQRYGNRIRYIYQENAGASAARNTGIKAARGEWLAFLDSDDEWMPGYLAKQIQRAGEVPGLCMQTTDCTFFNLDGRSHTYFEMNGTLAEFKGDDYLVFREPFSFIVKHGPWQVGATIIRVEAIKKAGLFDPNLNLSEDFDLMARVALLGSFAVVKEALVNIHRRSESIECLTGRANQNPLGARETDEKMYAKLTQIKTLSHRERKALNEVMSANRRAIGNLMMQNGNVMEARECYRRALFIHPSVRSLGKYLLSWSAKLTNFL